LSLGIAFKGPEGIVLAADSRVTLTATLPNNQVLPAYYDNATKLLKVGGQDYVGVVTYGQGAIGQVEPRTAQSYVPEFEVELGQVARPSNRLSVQEFAQRLSDFFLQRWQAANMPANADPMIFLVAGFDEGAPYGRVFQISIPNIPAPVEQNVGQFGITLGGQSEFVTRLLAGYDQRVPGLVAQNLGLTQPQTAALDQFLRANLGTPIPYNFLPLQDCVDLAILLIRTTVATQAFTVGIRGVGGSIDVATITRIEGFQPIQTKRIVGER
jgi:20S proteasome alpha/beta subunit